MKLYRATTSSSSYFFLFVEYGSPVRLPNYTYKRHGFIFAVYESDLCGRFECSSGLSPCGHALRGDIFIGEYDDFVFS